MDDHYFGAIKPRVAAYMADLNEALWKLGILAKTEHNEVAPAQHELAPIYTTTNIATDHNQLTMEIMQKIALQARSGLPASREAVRGRQRQRQAQQLVDLDRYRCQSAGTGRNTARKRAVPVVSVRGHQGGRRVSGSVLRLCVATAGNDHRLGANEAPPAVVSVFLGDELTAILKAIESDTPYNAAEKSLMKLGVHVLPKFPKDTTDRNRTSPFAFTGNKFEFRMLGSSNSIACANIMLNAAVAESLKVYADRLENASDFEASLHQMIQKTIRDHKHIIFNGNGYEDAWIQEATEERGLFEPADNTGRGADHSGRKECAYADRA